MDEIVPPGRNFPCNHAFGELFQKPGGLLRDVPGHKKLHVTGFQAGKVLFKVVEPDHNPLRVRMISQIFIWIWTIWNIPATGMISQVTLPLPILDI